MSEMVERVAKAICEASGEGWREGTYPIASGPNFEWEDQDADKLNNGWRFIARAAIEAMREPTDEMRDSCGNGECAKWAPGAWANYIDAALT